MFERILIPLDFSDMDQPAMEHAARMANPDSTVVLVHVIERIEHLDEAEDQKFYNRLEKLAARKMSERGHFVESLGLSVQLKLVHGKKVPEILGHARSQEIDLIVMGSTRVRWEKPVRGFDSTSHSIAMLAQCPIFLVKC